MATSCVWLHLRQKKLSGETSNGYSTMTKILHPVFFLSWDGVLCLISRTRVDRLMIISAFFHTHFGRSLFCFVLIRNICCLPHPVIPLNPSSCFLTNLLANLKAFHPFSQKWRLGDDAPSSRHIRTWNSREQSPWLSEAPLLRSPFQEIMFPSKWSLPPYDGESQQKPELPNPWPFICSSVSLSLSKYWRIFLWRILVKREHEKTWGSRI